MTIRIILLTILWSVVSKSAKWLTLSANSSLDYYRFSNLIFIQKFPKNLLFQREVK